MMQVNQYKMAVQAGLKSGQNAADRLTIIIFTQRR
jgi:hypothetical protein